MEMQPKSHWSLPVIFWTVSAISRALDQIIILERDYQSYLPGWVFRWDLGLGTVDAFHTYQGITLVAFGIACYYFYHFLQRMTPKYKIAGWLIAVYGYYQVFNLFFHVVFLKPEYWQFPFFRFLKFLF